MSPDRLQPSPQRKAWRFMAALGCLLGASSLLVGAIKWSGTDTRQDRQAQLTRQIISERARNVRRACEDTNVRHDATIGQLDALLKQRLRGATPATRARLIQSRAATILLIEALAPKRDCDELVRQQVPSSTNPK